MALPWVAVCFGFVLGKRGCESLLCHLCCAKFGLSVLLLPSPLLSPQRVGSAKAKPFPPPSMIIKLFAHLRLCFASPLWIATLHTYPTVVAGTFLLTLSTRGVLPVGHQCTQKSCCPFPPTPGTECDRRLAPAYKPSPGLIRGI